MLSDVELVKHPAATIPAKPEHLINGGSVIVRRKACSGSLKMEVEHGVERVYEATKKGTRVHHVIELFSTTVMTNAKAGIPLFDNLPSVPAELHGDPIEEDEIELAQNALLDVLEKIGPNLAECIWFAESKFILDEHLQLGGTVDFIWAYRDKKTLKKIAGIWDYKNGGTPVDAEETLQLALYACGVQKEFGLDSPFDEFHTYIFQPNSRDRDKTSTCKNFNKEEIEALTKDFFAVASRALGYDGLAALKLKAGKHCQFCNAKGACPEYLKPAQEKALALFTKHPVKPTPEEFPKALSDEALLDLLRNADYIEECISAVKHYIKERNLGGKFVKGTKLINGQSKTVWNTERFDVEAMEQTLNALGVQEATTKKLVSISTVKDALKAKKLSKEDIEKVLSPLTTKTTPSVKVVLAEDLGEDVATSRHAKAIELMSKKPHVQNAKT